MTAKDYLKQYQALECEIASKLAEIGSKKAYEELLLKKDKVNKLVAEIETDILKLCDTETEIRKKIEAIDNSYYRTILTEVYINGRKLEEVAELINYGYRQTCRLHGKALLAMKDVLECPIKNSL